MAYREVTRVENEGSAAAVVGRSGHQTDRGARRRGREDGAPLRDCSAGVGARMRAR